MAESGPPYSTYGQRLDHTESTQSLLSRRGSEFGNRYVQIDDSGIYLSSLAVTILLSSIATIGILLFTLVITLSVMLGSCQSQPMVASNFASLSGGAIASLSGGAIPSACASFRVNAEMNNLQGWLLPKECQSYIAKYMHDGQYYLDFERAVNAARGYLRTVPVKDDGMDSVVLDIDDTVLSNLPYYVDHQYGSEAFNETSWDQWVDDCRAPPLTAMLSLYKELRAANWSLIFITGRPEAQRNSTARNLLAAGYSGWASLNLRLKHEVGTTAVDYKSARRLQLQSEGYRIWVGLGDQWSDITGAAVGNRTFKLPNPMYYIF